MLKILNSVHYCTGGYIISNATARQLLSLVKQLSNQELKPIDHILFRHYLRQAEFRVYQFNPAILIQEQFLHNRPTLLKSSIEKDRKTIRLKKKPTLSILQKLCREINKIPEALRKIFIYKKVDFKP